MFQYVTHLYREKAFIQRREYLYKEFRNKKEKGLSCRLTPYVFNLQPVNIQRNIMQQA